jgi:eukaryotic-like serine/threonine-protein kinase
LETLGRYRIVRKLGEGGMGIVYAAHDDRLDRPVAIKRIRAAINDDQERQRFWREARAAASVNHPNVCQLYEIDEDAEGLFLAMELLEGEPLSARLARGPLGPNEAVRIALAVLSALAALHQKGIVHRDLKPSNIFLSPHGVKLLDFGLARPFAGEFGGGETNLTQPGMLLGTPSYMAPEMIERGVVDARSDLFVMGIVLYEILAGKRPFGGDSVFQVARAILQDEPPALGGSPGIVGLDRIIHRALSKRAEERYQTAELFAQDLRSTSVSSDSGEVSHVRPMTRIVVMPFRVLRPDPSIDFLAFSLPDAISSALSGLPALVVRSTAAASRFATDTPDIPALAGALDVDVVVLGTLLSSSQQVRVSAQLVQAPSGTLVRAMTTQSPGGEIFQLQDELAKSIVESLSLSLTAADRGRINRDAPASAEGYERYLRANEIQLDSKQWAAARDLYLQCLEHDPAFAPAWARLGRCYRLLGKYGDPANAQANLALGEDALKRALDINPELSLAHNLYAHVEVDAGRSREAVARLLGRVRQTPSEPELFAGLVHACRYSGLLEASVAAYERARRLDPAVITSAAQTFLLLDEWQRALAADRSDPPFTTAVALFQLGRGDEGLALLRKAVSAPGLHPQLHNLLSGMIAAMEGRHEEVIRRTYELIDSGFGDPEVFYHWAGSLAQAGDHDGALGLLERSINGGFHPASSLARDPRFDPVRATPDFGQIVRRASLLRREALEAFRAADGLRLLGLPQD